MTNHSEITILALLIIMLVGITTLGILDKRRDRRHVVALTSARLEKIRTIVDANRHLIRPMKADYDVRVVCETRDDYDRFDAHEWLRSEIDRHPDRWHKYVRNAAMNKTVHDQITKALNGPFAGYSRANEVTPMSRDTYRKIELQLISEILPDVVGNPRYHVIAHYDDLKSAHPLERETVVENDEIVPLLILHDLNDQKEGESPTCDTATKTSESPTPSTEAS